MRTLVALAALLLIAVPASAESTEPVDGPMAEPLDHGDEDHDSSAVGLLVAAVGLLGAVAVLRRR